MIPVTTVDGSGSIWHYKNLVNLCHRKGIHNYIMILAVYLTK